MTNLCPSVCYPKLLLRSMIKMNISCNVQCHLCTFVTKSFGKNTYVCGNRHVLCGQIVLSGMPDFGLPQRTGHGFTVRHSVGKLDRRQSQRVHRARDRGRVDERLRFLVALREHSHGARQVKGVTQFTLKHFQMERVHGSTILRIISCAQNITWRYLLKKY